jgi:transcriptional regulator with XRE-family HTH domain
MNNREGNGRFIAQTRKEQAYTQQEMSIQTGINKSTLSQIENGRFSGSLDIYERYIDALGLQLKVEPKIRKLPDWDEIDSLFGDD